MSQKMQTQKKNCLLPEHIFFLMWHFTKKFIKIKDTIKNTINTFLKESSFNLFHPGQIKGDCPNYLFFILIDVLNYLGIIEEAKYIVELQWAMEVMRLNMVKVLLY